MESENKTTQKHEVNKRIIKEVKESLADAKMKEFLEKIIEIELNQEEGNKYLRDYEKLFGEIFD